MQHCHGWDYWKTLRAPFKHRGSDGAYASVGADEKKDASRWFRRTWADLTYPVRCQKWFQLERSGRSCHAMHVSKLKVDHRPKRVRSNYANENCIKLTREKLKSKEGFHPKNIHQ